MEVIQSKNINATDFSGELFEEEWEQGECNTFTSFIILLNIEKSQ